MSTKTKEFFYIILASTFVLIINLLVLGLTKTEVRGQTSSSDREFCPDSSSTCSGGSCVLDSCSQNSDGSWKVCIKAVCPTSVTATCTVKCVITAGEASASAEARCLPSGGSQPKYICYVGFCYECSKEPKTTGGFIDLRSGNCKVVEPAKCKANIGSDCKAKVGE